MLLIQHCITWTNLTQGLFRFARKSAPNGDTGVAFGLLLAPQDAQRPAAGGSHGSVAVGNIVGVNHSPFTVGGDGCATADVADDQVQFVIAFSLGSGKADADLLLVEGVDTALPADALPAGDPRFRDQLVHIGGIDHKRLPAILLCKGMGQLRPRVAGCLTVKPTRAWASRVAFTS